MNNTFSVSGIFKQGWVFTKKHLTFLVVATLVYIVLSAVLGNDSYGGGSLVLNLASMVVNFIFTVGMINISLLILSGGVPTWNHFKTSFNTFLNILVACILTSVLVVLGLVLLIIPGIIIALRLSFASWLVVDKKMTAWDAVQESWRMTKGYSWKIFVFALLAGLIALISLIPFGLGLLISIPLILISQALLYKKILAGGVVTHTDVSAGTPVSQNASEHSDSPENTTAK